MILLPAPVRQAWDDRDGPVILTTVASDGTPNSIYATCVSLFDEQLLVVADNYFNKTRTNIRAGCKGSLLFRAKNGDAYQVKGTMEYHTDGAVFDQMKIWNPPEHPGHAAAVMSIEEVYAGGKKLA